jgi:hypothetical protein
MTNATKRELVGSNWLGNASSTTITHSLNLDPNMYSVSVSLNDHNDTTQVSALIVASKSANSFIVKVLPTNASSTASVSWRIAELVVQ